MKGVPENYGIDREKIKLLDREKIDDFKKLIRVLQEDNYSLEEERAKLKHMLKQQSMLCSRRMAEDGKKPYAGFDLTSDQVARVDEFILKLLNGDTQETSDFYRLRQENEKLKA
jgi:ribosomal protein L9